MSFLKLAFPLSLAGLLAGFAVSFIVTPRYTATAVMAVRDKASDSERIPVRENIAKVKSDEELSEIIQAPRSHLYEEERAHMPIAKVAAMARDAIQISWDDPGARSLSLIHIRTTYRTRRGAMEMANSVMSQLIRNQFLWARQSAVPQEEREHAFQARIEQLKIRLAALQAHTPVPPREEEKAITVSDPSRGLDPLDMPTVPQQGFPNRLAIALAGGVLGLVLAIPIARRKRYH